MATAYTSFLGLALPVTGELSGSWGDVVNDSITSLLDSAISGTTTLSADADVTLTTTDGVANQARQAILLWTAGGTTTRNITAPAQSKAYFVINKTSSTQSIVIRGAGPTTGVTVRAGQQALVVWNGVDFVEVASGDVDGPSSATDNAVARFDGTTGKLIQNSVVTIADSTGNMAGVGTLGVGAITTSGALTYGGVTLNNAVTGTGDMVLSTSPTLVTPALGTPSALVGTNITGTAAGLTAGNVTTNANLTGAITSTGNATLLGSFSSANLAGALTDETGTGSAVFANSPTLVTPALGTPASGVVTNLTGTASININGTVGATTANTGAFTTLSATGNVTLGDATTDTVTVNGYMGVGGVPSASQGLRVASTALTGTGQVGIGSSPVGTSAATSSISAFFAAPGTAASAFTTADTFGLYVNDLSKGAGSTVTRQSGIAIADQTQGTSNFGIQSLVSSGTNKWNVYASGTAANYFAGNVQFAAGSAAAPALTRFGDDNTGIFFPAADTIAFAEGGSERMRIDSSGNLIRGATAGVTSSGGGICGIETLAGDTVGSSIGQYAFATTNAAPFLEMGFSRNATVGSQTVVNSGDIVGAVRFSGSDGTNFVRAAQIVGVVDGTPGTNDMPGRLAFSTSADGSATPTERMRIDSAGTVGIGTTSPSASAILDAQSTTKGVRMPNMTTAQKNAIASPAAGLMVYDTTLAKLCVYTTAWETITSL